MVKAKALVAKSRRRQAEEPCMAASSLKSEVEDTEQASKYCSRVLRPHINQIAQRLRCSAQVTVM